MAPHRRQVSRWRTTRGWWRPRSGTIRWALEAAYKALEVRIKNSAKDIQTKYLDPPRTTDFAIMFLPTEGLYAEVLRRPGLVDSLQRDLRVVVAGPTTLGALLNSLQMGFRILTVEQRSSEVWQLLGAVQDPVRPVRRPASSRSTRSSTRPHPPSKRRPARAAPSRGSCGTSRATGSHCPRPAPPRRGRGCAQRV